MNVLYNLGLVLVPDFLTESEEQSIVSNIPPTRISKTSVRNSIRRYGSKIPYKNQIESETIPFYLDNLSQKIVDHGLLYSKPNSVSINEYLNGNAISPHIDSLDSGPIITIISLLSEATMVFEYCDQKNSIIIPPRSLLQLKDDIRYKWQHSILPVKNKRYSIVFRNG